MRSKETRGDLRVPCLDFKLTNGECLLFSQVTVQTRQGIYRLDALVCIYTSRNRIWCDLEVDGQGHDPRFDLERQRALGLPTVRLNTEDLTTPDILATLEGKISPLLGLPKAG